MQVQSSVSHRQRLCAIDRELLGFRTSIKCYNALVLIWLFFCANLEEAIKMVVTIILVACRSITTAELICFHL